MPELDEKRNNSALQAMPAASCTESVTPNCQDKELPVKGRFARYISPFLQLLLPVLSTRYLWIAYEDINPGNLLNKPHPSTIKPDFKPWEKPPPGGYIRRNIASLGMGTTLLGILSYYSKRTYDDIRTLYAEAVGYELNKKPEDVGFQDILFNSKNAALAVSTSAFIKRSLARFGAAASFFVPWQIFRDHKDATPKYDANINAGTGVMGTYLSLDGFYRSQSFFEAEQELADVAINHVDVHAHSIIGPKNIASLLLLQRRHADKNYKWPLLNSPEGHNESVLSNRIADLMNQTYNNTTKTEHANFTMGKFNFLVGFGLLDHFPTSLAFVELANKSADMKDVKAASAALNSGQSPEAVFHSFGIDIHHRTGKDAPTMVESGPIEAKFTGMAPQPKEKIPPAARSHQDFATQTADQTLGI